jgi:hypothetical protein
MDDALAFALRLAERVAPDEVELAPAMVTAAAEGGPDWRRLLDDRARPLHGGVIPELDPGTLLPLLDALRQAAPTLLQGLLISGAATLTIVREWVALRDRREQRQALPDSARRQLAEVVERLRDRLIHHGMHPDRAANVVDLTLETLCEHPREARALLERVCPDR